MPLSLQVSSISDVTGLNSYFYSSRRWMGCRCVAATFGLQLGLQGSTARRLHPGRRLASSPGCPLLHLRSPHPGGAGGFTGPWRPAWDPALGMRVPAEPPCLAERTQDQLLQSSSPPQAALWELPGCRSPGSPGRSLGG